ncbi:predicted protein [Naegleria gruberi]|uniref:Predicted protein n=1 Tax=Naegleria gruberi TaxID=5762 RepID=D2W1Q2_NAEGR|nr:uncharacterized protein NAEGRDRAFT_54033 [Naegleria gruberi]EFC37003.1 predicted protein [Naegleria gruberi]|eukprot:XP_002669747.1 predicted protein [Naegleria gruberi strain NEG-M]
MANVDQQDSARVIRDIWELIVQCRDVSKSLQIVQQFVLEEEHVFLQIYVSCQFKTSSLFCYGKKASKSDACSGHGACIDMDVCNCDDGYYSVDCSKKYCGSYNSTDTRACSGRGSCGNNGICTCQLGFYGDECEKEGSNSNIITNTRIDLFCNGLNATDESVSNQICSGNGKCIGTNTCSCELGYSGSDCEKISCYGLEMDHEYVCGGVGQCVSMNQCLCPHPYDGQECEQVKCLGKNMTLYNSTDYSRVCLGRGNCSQSGCECQLGFYGDACEMSTCFGLKQNDSLVCSGHGQCMDLDMCECYSSAQNGYWFGDDCSVCDPFHSGDNCKSQLSCSNEMTCNNLGICSPDNSSCSCSSDVYVGSYCDECKENYFGPSCQVNCVSNSTCNGNGECSRDGLCDCYHDLDHGYWTNGTCNECLDGYYGMECKTHVKNSKFSFDKFGYFVKFTIIAPIATLFKIETTMNPICNTFFNSPRIGQLPVYCNFTISSLEYLEGEMVVQLPSDSQLVPGDDLQFKILHFEDPSSNQLIRIQSDPQEIIPPLPFISTLNSTITYESSIALNAINSRNEKLYDENLYFEWYLFTSSLNSIQEISNLNQSIHAKSGTNAKSIKLTNLPVGSHVIQLKLKNRFNVWSESAFLNITKLLDSSTSSSSQNSVPIISAKILLNTNPFYYTTDLVTTLTQSFIIKKQITINGIEVNHPTVKVAWEVLNSANVKPTTTIFDYNCTENTNYELAIVKSTVSGYGNYTINLRVYNMTTNQLLISRSHRLIFIPVLTKISFTATTVTTFTSSSPDFPYKLTLNFPQSSFADPLSSISWKCTDTIVPDTKCDSDMDSIMSAAANSTVISIPANIYLRRSRSVRVHAFVSVGKYVYTASNYMGAFNGIAYSGWTDSSGISWGYSSGVGHWFAFAAATSYSLYMLKPPNWLAVSGAGALTAFDYLNNNQAIGSYSNYLQLDNSNNNRVLKVIPGSIPSSIKILKTVRSLTEDGVPMELDMYFVNENFIPPTISFQTIEMQNQTNGWIYFKVPFSVSTRYHNNYYIYFNLNVGTNISIQITSKDYFQQVAEFALPQFLSPFTITYSLDYFSYDATGSSKTLSVAGTLISLPAQPLNSNLNARAFQLRMKYHADNGFGGDITSFISNANTNYIPVIPIY